MPYKDPDKQREYQRNWYNKRRQQWLEENGPCACGSTKDLEVHHKDPTKKVTHRVWSWSAERRATELAKCKVECKECHRGKHYEDMVKPVVHGTEDGYTHHLCRCDLCKKANKAYRTKRKLSAQ